MGRAKGDIAIEPKARKECYRKDNNQREYMWRDNHKAEVYKLLGNDKVIDNKVPQRIQRHINSTTSPIAKEFYINSLPYGW
jgi:hypothetical protein